YNSPQAFLEFAGAVAAQVDWSENNKLRQRLIAWQKTSFTTSSEFLGELRALLKEVIKSAELTETVKQNIVTCISAIDDAFSKVQ
ncbi:MAG: hypothetical protein LBQ91_04500, partial [Oscillospiraceae bacterium]|nr:hypothetical protein [Oscillospiraceae bacterium]